MTDQPWLAIEPGVPVPIKSAPGTPEQAHIFDAGEITAINTALAARRALLVRGEPGTGKTQLAWAAAAALKRPIVSFVTDSRSESRDALWHFDAVRRLADAQVQGALLVRRQPAEDTASQTAGDAALGAIADRLDVENYLQPRAMWWGLDWFGALRQAAMARCAPPVQHHEHDPANGVVVLIDEIDKGDTDVPNGLLEVLGAGRFSIPGRPEPVSPTGTTPPPLVVITSNEERVLPAAFVRRCIALTLPVPTDDGKLADYLLARGRAHFPAGEIGDGILEQAARLLIDDRKTALDGNLRPLPGLAEFIDLLRAIRGLGGTDAEAQQSWLNRIAPFALRKYPAGGRA
jgi:MoxR-like ATPase